MKTVVFATLPRWLCTGAAAPLFLGLFAVALFLSKIWKWA